CRDTDTEMPPEVGTLCAEIARDATVLPLTGLSDEAVHTYLATCGLPPLNPELVQTVGVITQGNPLYLRSVVGRGALGTEVVLGGLEQEIARLIAQLAAPDRRLVGVMALLGMDVSVHEVARVAEAPPAEVVTSLARASALGIVTEYAEARM